MDKIRVTIQPRPEIRVSLNQKPKTNVTIQGKLAMRTTGDYDELDNLPTLNGVTIQGDHDGSWYGLPVFWFGTRTEYNALVVIDPAVCYCIEEGT